MSPKILLSMSVSDAVIAQEGNQQNFLYCCRDSLQKCQFLPYVVHCCFAFYFTLCSCTDCCEQVKGIKVYTIWWLRLKIWLCPGKWDTLKKLYQNLSWLKYEVLEFFRIFYILFYNFVVFFYKWWFSIWSAHLLFLPCCSENCDCLAVTRSHLPLSEQSVSFELQWRVWHLYQNHALGHGERSAGCYCHRVGKGENEENKWEL